MSRFKGTRVFFSIITLALVFTVSGCKQGSNSTPEEEAAAKAEIAQREAEMKAEVEAHRAMLKWQYESEEDAMGNTNKRAFVSSTNDIYLSSPYDGAQKGSLTIRHHSEFGKNILFNVEKGQIHGDEVTVRFDEEKAFSMPYSEAADGSSDVIFLNYNKLIGKLKTAKKMALQVMFYDNGNKIFEFDVSGLDLTKLN